MWNLVLARQVVFDTRDGLMHGSCTLWHGVNLKSFWEIIESF